MNNHFTTLIVHVSAVARHSVRQEEKYINKNIIWYETQARTHTHTDRQNTLPHTRIYILKYKYHHSYEKKNHGKFVVQKY